MHPGFPLDLTSRPYLHKVLSKRSSTDVGTGAHLPIRPQPMGFFLHFLPVTAHLILSMLSSWSPLTTCFLPSCFPFEPPLCCHLPRQGPQDPTLGSPLTHALITCKSLSLKVLEKTPSTPGRLHLSTRGITNLIIQKWFCKPDSQPAFSIFRVGISIPPAA